MDGQLAIVDQARGTAVDMALKFGPKVLAAVAILVVGYVVSRWAERFLSGLLQRLELEPPVRLLLVRLLRVVVIGLFAIMALQNLGIELLPLIAGLGIAGAGIALAMQGVLSNVAAGLTIILTRPFRVGEYISIAGEEGQVAVISLFSTTLTHPDRSRVVIPNRKISGEILHNYGRIRQLNLEVGVAYDTDLGTALGLLQEVLKRNTRVLTDPPAQLRVAAFADSAVSIAIEPWVVVDDYAAAAGELNRAVIEACRSRGIVMPLPQREVRLLGSG
jgi:small conductance mechanosensitive channel